MPKKFKVASIAFFAHSQTPVVRVMISASKAWQISALMISVSKGASQTPSMITTS